MSLPYTYHILTDQLQSTTNDQNYLRKIGFSDDAVNQTLNNWGLQGSPKFVKEYETLFGKTLNVSDGYTFFEDGNTNYMKAIIDPTLNEIIYKGKNPGANHIAVYKDMAMETWGLDDTTDLDTVNMSSPLDTSTYTVNGTYHLNDIKGWADKTNVATYDPVKFAAAYKQISHEADLLKAELHSNELTYSNGLTNPSFSYTPANNEKSSILKQQLDVQTQQVIKLYDELFTYYKQAGGSSLGSNSASDSRDLIIREKEAATAAAMNVDLAMSYAENYYSQTIKPTAAQYIFGQAPIAFSSIDPAGATAANIQTGRVGWTGDTINMHMRNTLSWYANTPGETTQLSYLFRNSVISGGTYVVNNISTRSDTTNDYAYDQNFFWATNDGIDEDHYNGIVKNAGFDSGTLADETGADGNYDPGTHLTASQLDEIGDSQDEYINWMVRDSYGVGGLTPTIHNTDYCRETPTYLSGAIIDAAQKLVDIKMQIEANSMENSINNKVISEYEARMGILQAMNQLSCPNGTDPYEINIDGQKYILGQDDDHNGSINNMFEILGATDSKENIFNSLKNLDTNNDGYVSQEEMQAQNIILGAVDQSGKLTGKGYDMGLVKGISLASLQNADGANNIFGKFTMDLQNKSATGNVTYENTDYFNKLLGLNMKTYDDISEDSSSDAIALPVSTTPANVPAFVATSTSDATSTTTTETTPSNTTTPTTTASDNTTTNTPATTADAATKTTEETTAAATTNDFSFNFTDANDNKSTIEKLFDQLCWKLNISNVTATQKYNILDGIDPNMDITLAETEIEQDLEKVSFSA